jgi:hypothetical protein
MSLKNLFATLEEIYNILFLIGQPCSSLAIIQIHALSLLQETVQIRNQFFLYMDPETRSRVINVYGAQESIPRNDFASL